MSEYNPLSTEVMADPYPHFREFQRSCPVHHHVLPRSDRQRINSNPLISEPIGDFYMLFAHRDIVEVAQNYQRFSSAKGVGPERTKALNDVGMLIYADPPHHTTQRRVLTRVLSPRRAAALEPRIREIADGLIDAFVADGQTELVKNYTEPLAGLLFCELLGVPKEDRRTYRRWAELLVTAFGADEEMQTESYAAVEELNAYFTEIFHERRAQLAAGRELPDDMLTVLMTTESDGRVFTDLEILLALHILIVGGQESVGSAIGHAVYLLSKHPDQAADLRADLSLLPNAIEEVLRFSSPAPCLFRVNTENVTISGVDIPADSKIGVSWAAANRDPAVFSEPDVFDIHRAPAELRQHLAFGTGVHACVGTALGRQLMRSGLETLLRRIPDVGLHNTREPVRGDTILLSRFIEIPVQWSVTTKVSGVLT